MPGGETHPVLRDKLNALSEAVTTQRDKERTMSEPSNTPEGILSGECEHGLETREVTLSVTMCSELWAVGLEDRLGCIKSIGLNDQFGGVLLGLLMVFARGEITGKPP